MQSVTSYKFIKKKTLFDTPVNIPVPGPYYTCLVEMSGLPSFPYKYALYFSTDHDPAEGGIWLYLCNDNPLEPSNWTSYEDAVAAGEFDHVKNKPGANPIYQDPVQGNGHTETPHVNVIDGTVYMTYHKNGIERTQRTLLATSPNGINFKRINGKKDSVVLRYDQKTDAGDGHTGYFRWAINPFPGIAQKYMGYSLHGGSDNYYSAIWASDDAITWERLDILRPIEGFAVRDKDRILIWHEMDPASIKPLGKNEFVAICGVGNRASGNVSRVTELYEVFLGNDGRTLKRQCRKILAAGKENAPDTEELAQPTSITINGTTHLIYIGSCKSGTKNTVLGASGKLKKSVRKSRPLKKSDQQRHIHR